MKKTAILAILLVILLGCTQEESRVGSNYNDEVLADSTVLVNLSQSLNNSQAVYNEETGDTVYFDFDIEYENDKKDKVFDKYYIVSSYSSYKNDDKLKEELARWQELEPNSYLEVYGPGATQKYYISLGKFKTREEVIPIFEEFKTKYPKERINFYYIVQ